MSRHGFHLDKLEASLHSNLPDDAHEILRNTQCAEIVELLDAFEDSVSDCSTELHEADNEGDDSNVYSADDDRGEEQDEAEEDEDAMEEDNT